MPGPAALAASLAALLLAARAAAQSPAPSWPAAAGEAVAAAPAAAAEEEEEARPRAQAQLRRHCPYVIRGKCLHPVRVAENGWKIVTTGGAPRGVRLPSKSCANRDNYHCVGCGLWRCTKSCHGHGEHKYCTSGGKVIPYEAVRGVESVTERSARKYEFLWAKARKLDSCKRDCAMLINPATCGPNQCYRSQNQMHIHAKQLSGPRAGHWVNAFTHAVCDHSGWKTVEAPREAEKCNHRHAKVEARRYDGKHIFKECLEHAGSENLRDWGVVVLVEPKPGCGQIVVMNRGCSFEEELMR